MDIFYGRFRLSGKRIRAMPQRSVTADRLAPTPISQQRRAEKRSVFRLPARRGILLARLIIVMEIPGVILFTAILLDCRSDLRSERRGGRRCAFPPYAC
jgi:hypothetical protein